MRRKKNVYNVYLYQRWKASNMEINSKKNTLRRKERRQLMVVTFFLLRVTIPNKNLLVT